MVPLDDEGHGGHLSLPAVEGLVVAASNGEDGDPVVPVSSTPSVWAASSPRS